MNLNKTKLAVDVFDKRAESYQEKFMDVSSYTPVLDEFCGSIANKEAAILDIACGPGNIAKYVLGKCPGYKLLGIDLAPAMLALAVQNNPGAEFRPMDCRDIVSLGQQYDAVICGFCMPYLSKEEAITLIADVAKILLPGGMFYFSTMEDEYAKSGMQTSSKGDSLYLHYHEWEYLYGALIDNGFRILNERHQEYIAPDGTGYNDLLVLAAREE